MPGGAGGTGSAGTGSPVDRREEIYRRIDETLGTFDGRIRAEQDAILADRNANGGNGAGGAGADGKDGNPGAGTQAGGKGDKADKAGAGGKGDKAGAGGKSDKGGGAPTDGGVGSDPSAAMHSDRQGAGRATVVGGGGAAPADVPDGRDDDIVARQIREAAMKETDPELRDKLWDEYRKYKKGK